jgi:hypothetical protein
MRARSEPVRAFSNKDEAVRFAGRQLGGHYAVYHKHKKVPHVRGIGFHPLRSGPQFEATKQAAAPESRRRDMESWSSWAHRGGCYRRIANGPTAFKHAGKQGSKAPSRSERPRPILMVSANPLPRNDRTPCTGLQKQSTAAAPRIAAGVLSLSASPPLRIIYIRLRLGSASCDSANSGPRDSGRATSL